MWHFWYGLGWCLAVLGMILSIPGSIVLMAAAWCEYRAAEAELRKKGIPCEDEEDHGTHSKKS